MKLKKVIIALVACSLIAGGTFGGISAYKSHQKKNLVAEVQPVANLNWGYWGDSETSYGIVTNDSSQEVYLSSSKTVKNVFVKEGDTVKTGDRLLEYDTAEIQIEIERKKLDISTIENDIAIAGHTLEAMRQAKPVDKKPPKLDTSKMEELERLDREKNAIPEKDKNDSRIYNYVTASSLPYNMKTDPETGELVYPAGTEEEPYIYYCNKDAYVYGSFFNSIRPGRDGEAGKYAKFIVCKKDANGMMVMEPNGSGGDTGNGSGGDTGNGGGGSAENGGGGDTENGGGSITESDGGSTENGGGGDTENGNSGSTESGAGIADTGRRQKVAQSNGAESGNKTASAGQNTESTGSTENTGGSTESAGSTENTGGSTENSGSSTESGGSTGGGSQVTEGIPVPDTSVSPNTTVFNGNNIPADYESSKMWYVFTGEVYVPTSAADKYMDDFLEHATDWKVPEGYTEEELVKGIAEKEAELKSLDIRKRQQELQLESMLQTASDGIVYATVDGIVKAAGDPDEFHDDGTAFLVVTGDEGLYVSGSISELLLQDVSVGTVVTANSWETGMSFEATITEIADYPAGGNAWGDGNPNVSYYTYTAYIEDSSALRNGESVDLSISTNQSESEDGGLFIEKAYVRDENGKPYCMIADENNLLKKQYVVTGRTVYGSAVEIKSGLSDEDRIAFPYGKEAVEGAAVKEAENMYY